MKKLKDYIHYSNCKTSSDKVTKDNYITTDNLLPHKQGKVKADDLPARKCVLTQYKKNDILISNIRPYLQKIWYANESGGASNDVLVLKVKDIHDSKYVYYALMQDFFFEHMMRGAKGSKMPRGDRSHILSFCMPEISCDAESAISSILSCLDEKININKQIISETTKIIDNIFAYWFLQFDFPDRNNNPYRSFGGTMISLRGHSIPDHWSVDKLSSLIADNKGGDWGKDETSGNYKLKVSCIRGADINYINGEDGISELPTRYVLNKNREKTLEAEDIIIEISGGSPTQSTGRATLITEKTLERFENPLICSNFCQAITLNDKRYSFYFYYLWKTFYDNGIFFNYEGKTSGLKNLLFDMFVKHTEWYIPDIDTIEKFNEIASTIHAKKEILLRENKELAELRDWLLPLLMNGQVTIKDATDSAEAQLCPTGAQMSVDITPHILAGHIVNELHQSRGMGMTKLQKALHLAEYHCRLPLNTTYYQNTAGPHSQELLNEIKQKFFQYQHVKVTEDTVNGKPHYTFTPTPKIQELEQAYDRLDPTVRSEIDALLEKLAKMDLGGAEILSTLYAVWNNRLIQGKPVTDDLLVTDFYAWSEHKSEFPESRVKNCLDYMRKDSIVPAGWGRFIDKKGNKKL